MSPSDKLLYIEDVMELLGLSRSSVERRMASGELPFVKLGSALRFRPQDLSAYVESRIVVGAPQKALPTSSKAPRRKRAPQRPAGALRRRTIAPSDSLKTRLV